MPRGWLRQNQILANRICQQSLVPAWDGDLRPAYQAPPTPTSDRLQRAPTRPWNFLAKQIPSSAPGPDTFVRAQTYLNLAQLACALERYCLIHHQYPERLEDLAPQFIRRTPQDFLIGQPLKYRRTPDGRFVLYSVGSDRVDNGGAFPVQVVDELASVRGEGRSHDEGDWVWRYPDR
jgi:hypothetical protein